jgi:hypothetical protein
MPRQAVELVINDRREPVERALIAIAPSEKKPAHIPNGRCALIAWWHFWGA